MGWLWSSGTGPDEPKTSLPSNTPAAQLPSADHTTPEPATRVPKPKKPLSRDELAEAEFQALVSEFSEQNGSDTALPSSTSNSTSTAAAPATTTTATTPASPSSSASISSISPQALVPTTMSCRTAFDYAFFCQSFGGQWVNVYRYGELRSCSEHWADFWFCMRTTSYPTEQREAMIADYHRKKADKYVGKPSSEDVWEMRRVPAKGAFEGDFEALEREMKAAEADKV